MHGSTVHHITFPKYIALRLSNTLGKTCLVAEEQYNLYLPYYIWLKTPVLIEVG